MDTHHPPSDGSIFVAEDATILVVGPTLDAYYTPTDTKLLLFQSPWSTRILRWVPGESLPTVDDIEHSAWSESVEVERVESVLKSFGHISADILAVVERAGLERLLGAGCEEWNRWLATEHDGEDSGSGAEGFAGASTGWHRAASAKLQSRSKRVPPPPRRGDHRAATSGESWFGIGPGFMSTAGAAMRGQADMGALLRHVASTARTQ